MKEGVPTSEIETASVDRARCYTDVADSLQRLLDAIPEAEEVYKEVTLPNGETIAADDQVLERLATAQLLRAGIEDLRERLQQPESVGGREQYYKEEALALTEEGVRHLEGFLAIQADLANLAVQHRDAARLGEVLYTVARTLLSEDEVLRNAESE